MKSRLLLEEEICLVDNLLFDNSSPHRQENLFRNCERIVDLLSPSPIPMRIVTLIYGWRTIYFLASDDSIHRLLRNDDYDSEGDIHFLEELLNNDSLPLPENESSNLDHFNDPSSSRPPPEPPDVKNCFDFKPDTGVVTNKDSLRS
ncbi:hypothetical protein Tco_1509486 [Tanacetum coccineum]